LLVNKKLLKTLFLDLLIIKRYVIISQDIVTNKVETKKNINIERKIKEKKKKKKKKIKYF
jgi:hypothetical protein